MILQEALAMLLMQHSKRQQGQAWWSLMIVQVVKERRAAAASGRRCWWRLAAAVALGGSYGEAECSLRLGYQEGWRTIRVAGHDRAMTDPGVAGNKHYLRQGTGSCYAVFKRGWGWRHMR